MGENIKNSTLNRLIRLPLERWNHIIEAHPEMKPYKENLIQGISNPDKIYYSRNSRHYIFITRMLAFITDWMIIYVKMDDIDAFVISAPPISSKRLQRNVKKWTLVAPLSE